MGSCFSIESRVIENPIVVTNWHIPDSLFGMEKTFQCWALENAHFLTDILSLKIVFLASKNSKHSLSENTNKLRCPLRNSTKVEVKFSTSWSSRINCDNLGLAFVGLSSNRIKMCSNVKWFHLLFVKLSHNPSISWAELILFSDKSRRSRPYPEYYFPGLVWPWPQKQSCLSHWIYIRNIFRP